MSLTLRQWIIVVVLAAGFIAAAIIVSDDATSPAEEVQVDFDEVAWCQAAGAVSARGGILDGVADDATADDIVNLQAALEEARAQAPFDLRTDLARLTDLVMLTAQALDAGTVAEALERGQAQTDQARVDAAVAAVSAELEACGHEPLT